MCGKSHIRFGVAEEGRAKVEGECLCRNVNTSCSTSPAIVVATRRSLIQMFRKFSNLGYPSFVYFNVSLLAAIARATIALVRRCHLFMFLTNFVTDERQGKIDRFFCVCYSRRLIRLQMLYAVWRNYSIGIRGACHHPSRSSRLVKHINKKPTLTGYGATLLSLRRKILLLNSSTADLRIAPICVSSSPSHATSKPPFLSPQKYRR